MLAIIASIATFALAFALSVVLGLVGLIIAGLLTAVGVGVAVSAMYGIEIKRSALIGLVFVVIDLLFRIGLFFVFAA